jgi:hypothetical protein
LKFRLPTPDEVNAFLDAQAGEDETQDKVDLRLATMRDLARIAEVAHLVDEGFLGDRAVLAGGMAMRLRGSSRVTKVDTDLSAVRGADITDSEAMDVLDVDTDSITLTPRNVRKGNDMLTVFPVEFAMRPAPVAIPQDESNFKVDLSSRGLELEPEYLPFRHDYPFELGLEGELISVMALIEATAEKVIGYGMFRGPKHYSDLAFVVDRFEAELQASADVLREVTAKKLEGWIGRFPGLARANGVTDFASLEPPFVQDRHLREVKKIWTQDVSFVGGAAEQYTFQQAYKLNTTKLVPILFARRSS